MRDFTAIYCECGEVVGFAFDSIKCNPPLICKFCAENIALVADVVYINANKIGGHHQQFIRTAQKNNLDHRQRQLSRIKIINWANEVREERNKYLIEKIL